MTRAHVVGAGLAGLAAAMALAGKGYAVTISEASPQAGGRCRSYHDAKLGGVIDNGNHLVLSGNHRVQAYLERIGAQDRLTGPPSALFDFADLRDGTRWRLRPGAGPLPWWILAASRRVPGTTARDYLPLASLTRAPVDALLRERLRTSGPLWDRLLEPLFVAALNTPPATSSARLAGAIVAGTLARGGQACRPLVARDGLSAAFVDPALAWLERQGATVRLGRRLRGLALEDARVAGLAYADGVERVAPGETVILAVPAWTAADLLPGLIVPDRHHAIVNLHYAVTPPLGAPPLVGVVGGTAEWVFAFADRLAVTISAADLLCDEDRETLARRVWGEVAAVHRLDPAAVPPWQVVRERRATFAATPAQDRRRPLSPTWAANLFLAGDWTQTGLPATIEGAILSGETAARHAIAAPC